jgi:hypothetical protein
LYMKYADEKIPVILNCLFHENGLCRTKNAIRKYYQSHMDRFNVQRNYLLDADQSYLCVFNSIYFPIDKINRQGKLFLLASSIKFTSKLANKTIELKLNNITSVRWNQQAANTYHLVIDFSTNSITISDFLAEDYCILKCYFKSHKKQFNGPLEISTGK